MEAYYAQFNFIQSTRSGWKQSVHRLTKTLDQTMEESDTLNDYYNCLIECDETQHVCKRICKHLLDEC